jgi:hypothetical protein
VQTLKTSAIIVLLATVFFGAYSHMTTPPDHLPQGIETALVESEAFDFSDGDPDFDIGIGSPVAVNDLDPPGGDSSLSLDAVDQTFADVQSKSSTTPPASFQFSDLDTPSPSSQDPTSRNTGRLPSVDSSASSTPITPDPEVDYPSTGSDFSLPDPEEAVRMAQQQLTSSSQSNSKSASNSMTSMELPGAANESLTLPASNRPSGSEIADPGAAGLANAIATADRQFREDRRREALATLSLFYETPNLTSEQREQLLIRLDPLARDVIYSPEHLLEEPHRVGSNETLMDVAQKYDVPWQLLANINGISDPVTVLPGKDLKVLRGPFRADVDLANSELTLFLGDLYAGRFPVGLGSDPTPRAGTYTVQEKKSAKTYYDLAGTPIPPGNPRNPYGAMWIDLGQGLSLHGSPNADSATDQGCISIAGNYSRDVFGILSEGSSITIR